MSDQLRTVSPIDGSIYVERPLATGDQITTAIGRAHTAAATWRKTSIEERTAICRRFVDAFVGETDDIATELTWQMGRPIKDSPGEVRGFEERARHMIDIAAGALADVQVEPKDGFQRFIRREPLGVVFVVAAWNYPYLISVNGVVPAIMAGNTVLLKHSAQTPLCAERFAQAFDKAGLPEGVFQYLHLSHAATETVIQDPRVEFVNFTGSVAGGRAVHAAAAQRFINMGLELGGKDPAYVRADANLEATVENLVDGSFYNAGQSCCGIERIYVHADLYDRFVERFVALVEKYQLGNPLEERTSIGPMVRTKAAEFVRGQIAQAISAGARQLVDLSLFPKNEAGTPYLAPHVLVDVDHSMEIMSEETFGPAVGIMKVTSDQQAVELMNDSAFGLTASIWSADPEATMQLAEQVETGTCYMNRCDYLDPALAWVGVKDSGRGCTLSSVGYEHLTRPKSFHFRKAL